MSLTDGQQGDLMLQPTPSPGTKLSTPSGRGSFRRTALLGLPAINVVVLSVVGFAMDLASAIPLIVAAAVLAPVELAALIAHSRSAHVSVLGLLAAIIGTAVITTLGFFLVLSLYFAVAFTVGCDGDCNLS